MHHSHFSYSNSLDYNYKLKLSLDFLQFFGFKQSVKLQIAALGSSSKTACKPLSDKVKVPPVEQ